MTGHIESNRDVVIKEEDFGMFRVLNSESLAMQQFLFYSLCPYWHCVPSIRIGWNGRLRRLVLDIRFDSKQIRTANIIICSIESSKLHYYYYYHLFVCLPYRRFRCLFAPLPPCLVLIHITNTLSVTIFNSNISFLCAWRSRSICWHIRLWPSSLNFYCAQLTWFSRFRKEQKTFSKHIPCTWIRFACIASCIQCKSVARASQ